MSAFNSTSIEGNLTDDPTLRKDGNGQPVSNLRIAVSEQFTRNGETVERVFYTTVVCWGPLAVNVASSLAKGQRVMVTGRLQERTIPASGDFAERQVTEMVADNVGISLRWAKVSGGEIVRSTNKELAAAAS